MEKMTQVEEMLAELKDYLKNTPPEKLKEDWDKYDTPEYNVGITVEEYFRQFDSNYHYRRRIIFANLIKVLWKQ